MRLGLGSKLLLLTVLFVMLSEVLIFVPSIANFRNNWLADAHRNASVAAAIIANTKNVPEQLKMRLLEATDTIAIAHREGNRRRLLAMAAPPTMVDRHVELGHQTPLQSIIAAFDTLFAPNGRIIRVTAMPAGRSEEVDVVLDETLLRHDMIAYSTNILFLSLVISAITAGLVYMSLRWLFVRPVKRLAHAMVDFAEDPEDERRTITPSRRTDEIGEAERSLAAMQHQLTDTIIQRRRLAELGMAVSKINHDLRNLLASAQLFSDRLAVIPDPTVQRFVPKLVRALDRAVGYTSGVLAYGRAGEAPPQRRLIDLELLAADVGEILGLDTHPTIDFRILVEEGLEIDSDPDQLYRVLMNLCRNAMEALESNPHAAIVRRLAIAAERTGSVVRIVVSDTGPGVPEAVRMTLFQPFKGNGRRGGTGLGLAIAAELVRAHGGSLTLLDTPVGASFELTIPDRPIDLAARRVVNA
ncbi:HAMP domain-containing histidine kinase [Acuticoccus sp. M5D2P5]|uniref:sensor histidine kinase n=1 Tax=Acuticoccus kalidii TaxID=2910977 RepID=UPI001F40450C|nr:HAMP domain-containing sensor histidine kinase [Acuticoccus kalidii]MCF3932274.1 HAMP domain-containing histidine kinase [Acuticoccus kalidii]